MVKDKRFVPIPVAIISLLIIVPVVFAALFFMILPSRPGCVQIMVKDPGGKPVEGVAVILVINASEAWVDLGVTGPGGRFVSCGKYQPFQPNTEYGVFIFDKDGKLLKFLTFWTNERSTADVPVITIRPY